MRNSKLNKKFILGALALTLTGFNAEAANCTQEKMNELRLAASAMSKETLTLSAELAICPEFRDEALLWSAFYNNQNGQYEENSEISDMLYKTDSVSDRYQILAEAGKGRYQKLKSLIDSNTPGYAGDAESHLVLARSLMRAKQIPAAHAQYEKYLSLKPDDLDVYIEQAYSYLWNDDWKQAQKRFRVVQMQKLTTTQKKTVDAGLEQTEKVRLRKMNEGGTQGVEVPLGIERVANSYKGFSRQSLLSGYHTPDFNFDAAIVNLNSDDYSTRQTAGQLQFSKNLSFANGVDIYGKAGWLQGDGGNYIVAGVISKQMKSNFKPLLGFESVPLVTIAPVPKQFTDWSQRSLFVGFNYRDRFEYRIYAIETTEQGTAAKQSLLFQLPIKIAEENGRLKFKVLAENLSAQQYSQYVYSPRDSTVILPGLIWSFKLDDVSEMKATVDYGFVSESLNAGANQSNSFLGNSSSGQLFGLGMEYRAEIEKDLDAEVKFKYDRTSSGGGTSYQSSIIYFGLIWRMDDAESNEK